MFAHRLRFGMVHNSRKWTNSSNTATNSCAYLPIAAVWPNSRLSLSNMGNRGFFIDGRLCCLAVLCAVFCNAAQAQELACRFNVVGTGKVARILDGRSFALDDGREVRPAGTAAPPPALDAADSARNALESMLSERAVALRNERAAQDRYGRLLAYVDIVRKARPWRSRTP